jgi:hypothetical protein
MSEKRDSDFREINGEELFDAYGVKPFSELYAEDLAMSIKRMGALKACPVFSDDGDIHRITAIFPEGIVIEICGGLIHEAIEITLKAQIDILEDSLNVVRKLKRLMMRRQLLENMGYGLRTPKGTKNDSKPGLNEERFYRLVYTKGIDTHVKKRVEAEVLNVVGKLLANFSEEDCEDPDAEIW